MAISNKHLSEIIDTYKASIKQLGKQITAATSDEEDLIHNKDKVAALIKNYMRLNNVVGVELPFFEQISKSGLSLKDRELDDLANAFKQHLNGFFDTKQYAEFERVFLDIFEKRGVQEGSNEIIELHHIENKLFFSQFQDPKGKLQEAIFKDSARLNIKLDSFFKAFKDFFEKYPAVIRPVMLRRERKEIQGELNELEDRKTLEENSLTTLEEVDQAIQNNLFPWIDQLENAQNAFPSLAEIAAMDRENLAQYNEFLIFYNEINDSIYKVMNEITQAATADIRDQINTTDAHQEVVRRITNEQYEIARLALERKLKSFNVDLRSKFTRSDSIAELEESEEDSDKEVEESVAHLADSVASLGSRSDDEGDEADEEKEPEEERKIFEEAVSREELKESIKEVMAFLSKAEFAYSELDFEKVLKDPEYANKQLPRAQVDKDDYSDKNFRETLQDSLGQMFDYFQIRQSTEGEIQPATLRIFWESFVNELGADPNVIRLKAIGETDPEDPSFLVYNKYIELCKHFILKSRDGRPVFKDGDETSIRKQLLGAIAVDPYQMVSTYSEGVASRFTDFVERAKTTTKRRTTVIAKGPEAADIEVKRRLEDIEIGSGSEITITPAFGEKEKELKTLQAANQRLQEAMTLLREQMADAKRHNEALETELKTKTEATALTERQVEDMFAKMQEQLREQLREQQEKFERQTREQQEKFERLQRESEARLQTVLNQAKTDVKHERELAEAARGAAVTAQGHAETARNQAQGHVVTAQGHARNTGLAQAAAIAAQGHAETARDQAQGHVVTAQGHAHNAGIAQAAAVAAQGLAENARDQAGNHVVAAQGHANNAGIAQAAAVLAQGQSENARDQAQGHVATALDHANAAQAARAAADADVVATHADVNTTHADVLTTHADVTATHADVNTTHGDVTQTHADRNALNATFGGVAPGVFITRTAQAAATAAATQTAAATARTTATQVATSVATTVTNNLNTRGGRR